MKKKILQIQIFSFDINLQENPSQYSFKNREFPALDLSYPFVSLTHISISLQNNNKLHAL